MTDNSNEQVDFPNPKTLFWTLVVGVILASIAPILFTGYIFNTTFDFSSTGSIGDTISGTTAPILSILGSILIFYSFRAQIRANEIQRKQLVEAQKQSHFDLIYRMIQDVKLDINSFKYPMSGVPFIEGVGGLARFSSEISNKIAGGNPFDFEHELNALLNIMYSIQYCLNLTDNSVLSAEDKKLLRAPLAITYETKLQTTVQKIEKAWQTANKPPSKNQLLERIIEVHNDLNTKLKT